MSSVSGFPVESFRVTGVHGYKDISMNMKGKTTVFVSENGAGKTTILNALRLVLERDFLSLKKIRFDSIFIKFKNIDTIEIKREDLNVLSEEEISSIFEREMGIDDDFFSEIILSRVISYINKNDDFNYREDSSMQALYMNTPLQEADFNEKLKTIKLRLNSNMEDNNTYQIINSVIGNKEIIFLPTYRRVEKDFERKKEKHDIVFTPRRRRNVKLHHDGITYGLKDVEDTLKSLTIEIERTSNIGYRSISAKMLNDLIKFKNNQNGIKKAGALPPIEDLTRFLGRVEYKNGTSTDGSSENQGLIDELKNLYSENKVKEITYLHYFLSQLDIVIQDTKEQEYKIESFVDDCNKYLTSSDDSKSLKFDPNSLEVIVRDDYTGERISLNSLSSGEKQVISLLALIHLSDNKQKIILIDEPELSLSMSWQRMILPDLSNSPNVDQMVAITHSPFIFDNELEGMATSMKVKKIIKAIANV